VQYLLQLAKGLSLEGPDAPADVFRHVPDEKWRVPFSTMIYVGDGASDVPAFELLARKGSLSIGVVGPGGPASDWGPPCPRRPLAVEAIAKLVALRRLGRDE
jgi:hypothetical protein